MKLLLLLKMSKNIDRLINLKADAEKCLRIMKKLYGVNLKFNTRCEKKLGNELYSFRTMEFFALPIPERQFSKLSKDEVKIYAEQFTKGKQDLLSAASENMDSLKKAYDYTNDSLKQELINNPNVNVSHHCVLLDEIDFVRCNNQRFIDELKRYNFYNFKFGKDKMTPVPSAIQSGARAYYIDFAMKKNIE